MSDDKKDWATQTLAWLGGVAFPWLPATGWPWFTDNFNGTWDITCGEAVYGYHGDRFVNVLGADYELLFSPFSFLTPGSRNAFNDCILMGLGDQVSFCYGARINATYGGPHAEIIRGPRFRKIGATGGRKWNQDNPDMSGVVGGGDAGGELVAGPDASWQEDSEGVYLVVKVLSLLLNVVTSMIELWIRFKYEEYNDKTGGFSLPASNNHPDQYSQLWDLEIAHRIIPRRLMGIIYHIEHADSWTTFGKALWQGFKNDMKIVASVMTLGLFALGYCIYYKIAKDGYRTAAIVAFVVIILAIVGVALAGVIAYAAASGSF